MAQLSIPQSLIGALIDIADLGTLDYFAPSERCAHWALYDNQRRELLCPCAPAEVPSVEKLFESAAKILYENFPRYIDTPDQIIPYTSRQELMAALLRGEDTAEGPEDTGAGGNDAETVAEAGEAAEGIVVQSGEETSEAAEAVAPAAEKPKPSPALMARRARSVAEQETPGEQAVAEKGVTPSEAPKPSVPKPSAAQFAAPKPAPLKPSAPVAPAPLEASSETHPAAPKPPVPSAAPSPSMFRKASLTYRPPQIEEYLQGLRARQQAANQATEQNTAPENIASEAPNTPAPIPVPSAGAAPAAAKTVVAETVAPEAPARPTEATAARPAGVTAEDRERAYRIRPGLRQRMEREGLTEDLVRTILREGAAERVNDWTIRFRHDDYRVDVNTASAELITVVDEYEAEYNDGANTTLARGEYTPLNALEMAFSERARVFLSKNPEFVFDLMVRTLENPENVRMGEGWTRIYAAEGLEMTISPDQRTVLSLTKAPDFQALHAESLRRAQIEDLSDAINRQAEAATSEQPKHQNAQNAEEEK